MPELNPDADMVAVPRAAFADLVRVAAYMSAGRGFAEPGCPYPDAVARRALGALDDAGLIPTDSSDPENDHRWP